MGTQGTLLLLGLLSVTTGCRQTPRTVGENWQGPGEARAIDLIVQRQAESGAISDATLHPAHFDGTTLNSNGVTKLRLLAARSGPDTPKTVYVHPFGDDAAQQARLNAVQDMIPRLSEEAVALSVKPGLDPVANMSAVDNLTALQTQRDWKPAEREESGSGSGGSGK